MQLSTKITLGVALGLLAMIAVVWAAYQAMTGQQADGFLAIDARNKSLIVQARLQAPYPILEGNARVLTRDRDAIAALAAGETAAIAENVTPTFNRLSAQGHITHMMIFGAQGAPGFEAPALDRQTQMPGIARIALDEKRRAEGLLRTADGTVVTAIAFPLLKGRNPVGVAILGVTADSVLQDLANAVEGFAYMDSAAGRTASEGAPQGLGLAAYFSPKDVASVLIGAQGRHYSATQIPLQDPSGEVIATSYLALDITASEQDRLALEGWAMMVIGGSTVLFLVALVIWLKIQFAPMARMTDMMRRAAEGEDLEVGHEVRRRDEIGALAQSLSHLGAASKDLTHAASRIAEGDLTMQVTPRSGPIVR